MNTVHRMIRIAFCLVLLALAALPLAAQEATPPTAIQGVAEPEKREFSEELFNQLQLPDGFQINVFAQGLENPRIMVQNTDGTIYVSQRTANNVLALNDRDGDGVSDETRVVAENIPSAHGLTIRDNQLFIVGNTTLYVAAINEDGTLGAPEVIVDDLPESGQHSARTMAFGADGQLYMNIGSSCNACRESSEEYATIIRFAPDFSSREIFASGLRHTIGFGWHPETGELWGMDHGTDALGDDIPPEELNSIVQGQHYGWPYCYGDQQVNRFLPGAPQGFETKDDFCATTTGPVIAYQAHSSPIGFAFYTGAQFPEDYANDVFVAMRGSWNRSEPTGYKVVRIHFENGQPTETTDFLTGFLIEDGAAQFARLSGLLVLPDGSLLVADDSGGMVYRVSYSG